MLTMAAHYGNQWIRNLSKTKTGFTVFKNKVPQEMSAKKRPCSHNEFDKSVGHTVSSLSQLLSFYTPLNSCVLLAKITFSLISFSN